MSTEYRIGGGVGPHGSKAVMKREIPDRSWKIVTYFHGYDEQERISKARLWIQQQEQQHGS